MTDTERQHGNILDQRAQQIDPAGHDRVDANQSAKTSQKQPGHEEDEKAPGHKEEEKTKEEQGENYIRPAGPSEMDNPPKDWTRTDEEVDESFPASDPPGNY